MKIIIDIEDNEIKNILKDVINDNIKKDNINDNSYDELMDSKDACKYINKSMATLNRIKKEGLIQYIQNDKNDKIIFKKSFLDDYLKKNTKIRNRYN